jgi:tetratricopeptide (TPR) repeat protein
MTYVALVAGIVVGWLIFQSRGAIAVLLSKSKMDVGDYDGALRIVRWASLGFPNVTVLHAEGLWLDSAGRLSEAEKRFRKALAMAAGSKYPVARLHACLGNVLVDRGRFHEAEQCFLRAIKAGDDTGSSEAGLAELRLVQGVEAEKALEYADQAIDRGKRRPGKPLPVFVFYAYRAWALAVVGRGEEARVALAEALHVPESGASGRAEIHWRIGMALAAMQQSEDAWMHFEMGHKADPRGKYGHRCGEQLRGRP